MKPGAKDLTLADEVKKNKLTFVIPIQLFLFLAIVGLASASLFKLLNETQL